MTENKKGSAGANRLKPQERTTNLNDRSFLIRSQVFELAKRPRGVTRDEAAMILGRPVYKAFQGLRRKGLIESATYQRKSRQGKLVDVYCAVT